MVIIRCGRKKIVLKRAIIYFTLVEMLVVVAIIATLAALLMPSLQNALQTAYMISCQNNQRQLGISLNNYAIDWGGYIPGPMGNDEGGGASWKTRLSPSLSESPKLYVCPGNKGGVDTTYNKTPANQLAINMYLLRIDGQPFGTGSTHDNWWKPKKIALVKRPGQAALILEAKRSEQRGSSNVVIPGAFALSRLGDFLRHPGYTSNILYVDGHSGNLPELMITNPPDGQTVFWEGR